MCKCLPLMRLKMSVRTQIAEGSLFSSWKDSAALVLWLEYFDLICRLIQGIVLFPQIKHYYGQLLQCQFASMQRALNMWGRRFLQDRWLLLVVARCRQSLACTRTGLWESGFSVEVEVGLGELHIQLCVFCCLCLLWPISLSLCFVLRKCDKCYRKRAWENCIKSGDGKLWFKTSSLGLAGHPDIALELWKSQFRSVSNVHHLGCNCLTSNLVTSPSISNWAYWPQGLLCTLNLQGLKLNKSRTQMDSLVSLLI